LYDIELNIRIWDSWVWPWSKYGRWQNNWICNYWKKKTWIQPSVSDIFLHQNEKYKITLAVD